MRILHCVGARPNFVKLAPVLSAFDVYSVEQILVHTGQHYDNNMSQVFFRELGIRDPDANLEIGPADNNTEQVAAIMPAVRPVMTFFKPDWVVVYGDVNSTLACALAAAQLNIPIVHIEAGLRSFDRDMPEEVNRIVVDHLSRVLFCTERSAVTNLENEGMRRVWFVGNVMIDTLVKHLPLALTAAITEGEYVLVTLHRPRNVNHPMRLKTIVDQLNQLSQDYKVIFPAHPRTQQALADMKLGFDPWKPLGYVKFLVALQGAKVVVTDSGGVQEEAAYLGVPCLTVRHCTERPVTLRFGNKLISPAKIVEETEGAMKLNWGLNCTHPELWDGNAAERIAKVLFGMRTGVGDV